MESINSATTDTQAKDLLAKALATPKQPVSQASPYPINGAFLPHESQQIIPQQTVPLAEVAAIMGANPTSK